jgi:hypothetical protein
MTNTNWIDAPLKDTPYRLVARLSPTEVELSYGDRTRERWRFWRRRTVTSSTYRIKIAGRYYRFAGRIDGLSTRRTRRSL